MTTSRKAEGEQRTRTTAGRALLSPPPHPLDSRRRGSCLWDKKKREKGIAQPCDGASASPYALPTRCTRFILSRPPRRDGERERRGGGSGPACETRRCGEERDKPKRREQTGDGGDAINHANGFRGDARARRLTPNHAFFSSNSRPFFFLPWNFLLAGATEEEGEGGGLA